jgi:hypothetical protein
MSHPQFFAQAMTTTVARCKAVDVAAALAPAVGSRYIHGFCLRQKSYFQARQILVENLAYTTFTFYNDTD